MRTTLTIEQSAELIKRGVSADKASMVCMDFNGTYAYICGEETQTVRDCVNGQFYVEESRVFTLADLLSLLPKRICHDNTLFTLDIHANSVGWQTLYFNPDADINIGWACAAELIDSLYETLCFIIDRNHVKLD